MWTTSGGSMEELMETVVIILVSIVALSQVPLTIPGVTQFWSDKAIEILFVEIFSRGQIWGWPTLLYADDCLLLFSTQGDQKPSPIDSTFSTTKKDSLDYFKKQVLSCEISEYWRLIWSKISHSQTLWLTRVNHEKHINLTIKSDTIEQHLQFGRC